MLLAAHSDIYVMNADGSGTRKLTHNARQNAQPAWSPDGRKIAFRSTRNGNREIYVMNTDGSESGTSPGTRRRTPPSWSPDGRRIAFVSDRDGRLEAHVMNADGSGQRSLACTGETSVFAARASFVRARSGQIADEEVSGSPHAPNGRWSDGSVHRQRSRSAGCAIWKHLGTSPRMHARKDQSRARACAGSHRGRGSGDKRAAHDRSAPALLELKRVTVAWVDQDRYKDKAAYDRHNNRLYNARPVVPCESSELRRTLPRCERRVLHSGSLKRLCGAREELVDDRLLDADNGERRAVGQGREAGSGLDIVHAAMGATLRQHVDRLGSLADALDCRLQFLRTREEPFPARR